MEFHKYGGKKRTVDFTDPLKLFESLDVRTSHTTLRPAQIEALQALSARRAEHDHVLKMNTGAGKTTVALLHLRSHAAEKKRPVVYLCPTIQLVGQVLEEAERLGIAAVHYPAGEPHPDRKGISGDAIIVCTYEKLFNARTTFDRPDVHLSPAAIVLDDAHAGVERVREAFTIRIFKDSELHQRLLGLLGPQLKAYQPGIWSDIERGDATAIQEVPYWIWRPLIDELRGTLADHASDGELKFVWGHLRDPLEWCRCIVSGTAIEIVPDILPVERVRAYAESAHRLFTSATLADDSVLVRELACELAAALAPIQPASDQGVGERMVLAPSLINKKLDREWVMAWCAGISKRVNVVVLTPTNRSAADWMAHGAKVVAGEDVTEAVRGLRSGKLPFVAFANRYDGIDLPDDACRVLVLDGMPFGEAATARYDATIPGRPGSAYNHLVHRIEQGMGRAVRSHADYAVVVLCGPDLAHFVARIEILDLFNPSTRGQIELAHDLVEIALNERPDDPVTAINDLLWAALKRDEGWKDLYDEKVRGALRGACSPSRDAIALAQAERAAVSLAFRRDPGAAADELERALTAHARTDQQKGWYLQTAAKYRYAADAAKALQAQVAAHEKNEHMFPPPMGAAKRPEKGDRLEAPAAVLQWYGGFANVNGAIAAFQDVRARLSFDVSADTMEQALLDLAIFLGADGSRPEKTEGRGPDDLWLWTDASAVIEAKNEAKYDRLPKKDSGQLHDSMQWFREHYPTRSVTPLVVARTDRADDAAHFPPGTRVLTPEGLAKLLGSLEAFLTELSKKLADQWTATEVGQLQARHKLTPSQVFSTFTVLLR